MVRRGKVSNVLFLFVLAAGLFLTWASVSHSNLEIAQVVYGTADSGYVAPGIEDTVEGMTGGATATQGDIQPISATFNEPMDGITLNSSTFTVRDSNGNNIPGTVSLASDNKTATFIPLSSLVYSTEYIATINTGAKDLAGNPLPTDNSWSFITPNVEDNQSEDISDVSFYDPAGNNITSNENVLANDTANEKGGPFYSYPDLTHNQQGQQLINGSVSSTTSSLLPVSEQARTTAIESSLQPSAAPTSYGTASNSTRNLILNQSFPAITPLTNTQYNSITALEQKGAEVGFATSQQQSDLEAMLALQSQQQYQSNLLPYQQYYQYPPQQLNQNQQFSYPSSNLTNIPDGTGLQPPSSLSEGAASVLQQPIQQQPPSLSPSLLTGIQPSMGASPPETLIISAIDNNGQNIPSGSTVSSQFISLIFVGVDDAGQIMDFQCSYDGQLPYSCGSPFIIDNSLVVIPTNIPIVPSNNNTHTLLISAVDSSRNIDQTPASFVWTIVGVQGSTETIPGQEPVSPALPLTVPQTEFSQQQMSQQQAEDIAQESLYSNVPSVEP